MKNTIYTAEEYMAQGFAEHEVPMIQRHDELFNKGEDRTEEETEEMFALVKALRI